MKNTEKKEKKKKKKKKNKKEKTEKKEQDEDQKEEGEEEKDETVCLDSSMHATLMNAGVIANYLNAWKVHNKCK